MFFCFFIFLQSPQYNYRRGCLRKPGQVVLELAIHCKITTFYWNTVCSRNTKHFCHFFHVNCFLANNPVIFELLYLKVSNNLLHYQVKSKGQGKTKVSLLTISIAYCCTILNSSPVHLLRAIFCCEHDEKNKCTNVYIIYSFQVPVFVVSFGY